MNTEQADALVDRILGAFPGHGWPYTTVALYAETLESVDEHAGARAVNRAITTLDRPPSLKWLLDTARAETARTSTVIEVFDADQSPAVHPAVARHAIDAFVTTKAEADRSAAGADGHWHGGPDPCLVCGGIAPHLAAKKRP